MLAAADVVLELLGRRAKLASHQVRHLHDWWQAAAAADEPLVRFLARQGLISEAVAQILHQVAEGHLSTTMGFALLDPREFDDIRRRLPEVAIMSGALEAHPTVTLLKSGDTTRVAPTTIAHEPPRVGSTLGKYLLTEWVGQGTTGNVFRALHPTLHIPVAIKVLHGAQSADEAASSQLESEARLLAQLNHPNIVRVYDFEAQARYPFLVLEHVNGPTLAELIDQSGRIQPRRVVRIIRQLAAALDAAHRLGVVHRDVKPANVLLTRSGEVKLADLGLATLRRHSSLRRTGTPPNDTRAGTACYMAPELIGSARPADERSDMYSLGATFYHALTGQPPFLAPSAWQVIEMHQKSPPPNPRLLVPNLPPLLSDLVVAMLAKNPATRPATFRDLLDEPALACDYEDISIPSDRPALWQRLLEHFRRRSS